MMNDVEDADTLHIPQAVKRGYISCNPWGVFDMSYPKSKLRRARVQGGGGHSFCFVLQQWYGIVHSI